MKGIFFVRFVYTWILCLTFPCETWLEKMAQVIEFDGKILLEVAHGLYHQYAHNHPRAQSVSPRVLYSAKRLGEALLTALQTDQKHFSFRCLRLQEEATVLATAIHEGKFDAARVLAVAAEERAKERAAKPPPSRVDVYTPSYLSDSSVEEEEYPILYYYDESSNDCTDLFLSDGTA